METVIVAGVFALIGAALGSLLTGFMQRRLRDHNARAERLDTALRSVAVAIATQDFSWRVGMDGVPESVSEQDEAESAKSQYLRAVDRHLTALYEAKRDLAILAVDGFSSGLPLRYSYKQLTDVLPDIYQRLVQLRRAKNRR